MDTIETQSVGCPWAAALEHGLRMSFGGRSWLSLHDCKAAVSVHVAFQQLKCNILATLHELVVDLHEKYGHGYKYLTSIPVWKPLHV